MPRTKTPKLKFFDTPEDVLGYIESEFLATLRDDLDRMTHDKYESRHYTAEDRREMRNKIADIEKVLPLLALKQDA